MNKIKVINYIHIHYYGQCDDCDFDVGIDSEHKTTSDVRNEIRQHVLKTGHTVILGKGSETIYKIEE